MFRTPLTNIFGGAEARVLDALLVVDRSMTVRQVARVTGMSTSSASTALRSLLAHYLVRRDVVGNAHAYRVNPEHHAYPGLRAVAVAAAAVTGELGRRVAEAFGAADVRKVVLHGSTVRGEAVSGVSDVDVVVVARSRGAADRMSAEWPERARAVADWLGADLDVVVTSRPTGLPADAVTIYPEPR